MTEFEKKAWAMRNFLVARVLGCSPFCIPEPGNCSGSNGDATEVGFKCEVGCYKSASEGVADIGNADMYKMGVDPVTGKKRRYSFEIKTRCGTLGVNTARGYKWKSEKYDFFVYFIDASDFNSPLVNQCIVVPSNDFMRIVEENNLFHYYYKKEVTDRVPENSYKCNIQSYTSKRKRTAWEDALNFEGMLWKDFAELYQIKW